MFALIEVKEIVGKLKFYKLLINNTCEFDLFCEQCIKDGNLKSEIIQLQARMQQIADLNTLPIEKYRDITPKKDPIKEYEIKTKHLRAYLFHDKENGRVIVSCGKKTTQKADISSFRKTKKEYFNLKT